LIRNKKNICFVVTSEFAVRAFLLAHIQALSKSYNVTLLVNSQSLSLIEEFNIQARVIHINIQRNINLISDFSTLLTLLKIFYTNKFFSVHSITPKAGLLAMAASWILRTPVRIHTFTGQVWATKTGVKRFILKLLDKLFAGFATHIIVDSPSQLAFIRRENVISTRKGVVFNYGSICGVNLEKFKPNLDAKKEKRKDLNIPQNALLILYLGRLNTDKGVLDLARAFANIDRELVHHAHLIYVGPDEESMQQKIKSILKNQTENLHFVDCTTRPEYFLASADILCLPSYREGFGNVIIEAAAVGIPSIASRIYGISDAIVEMKTGLLHAPKDSNSLTVHLNTLLSNNTLRKHLGAQARKRVIQEFDSQKITRFWIDFYKNIVQ